MGAMAFPSSPTDGQEYDKWYYDAASEEWKLIASLKDPLWRDNEDGSIYYSNGNVGIGTDSPRTPLDTNGTIRTISKTGAYPADGKGLEIYYESVADTAVLLSYDRGVSSYKPLRIEGLEIPFFTSGTERMRIDSSGNATFSGNVNWQNGTTDARIGTNIFNSGDNLAIGTVTNHSINFYTNNVNTAPRLTIGATGNATFSGNVSCDGKKVYAIRNGKYVELDATDGHDPRFSIHNGTKISAVIENDGSARFDGTVNSTALALGNWKIELDGNNLAFKYNGTKVFKLETTGKVISKNDVRAFGTP